jgi:transposase-like protein
LYYRLSLSLSDVEKLLAKRGITVTDETIRHWCRKFGPEYARELKRRQGRLGDVCHLDEVFVKIGGERRYLWRAVDQDRAVIDILVQLDRGRPVERLPTRLRLRVELDRGVRTRNGPAAAGLQGGAAVGNPPQSSRLMGHR